MEPAPDDPWRVSWEAINARAWWRLNRSSELPPSVSGGAPFHGLPRLRLWNNATGFGCDTEPTTLTVYEVFPDVATLQREPVVREAVWRRGDDLDQLSREMRHRSEPLFPRPTVVVRDAPVPAERLDELLAEATVIRMPAAWFWNDESVTASAGRVGFEFYSRDQPSAALKLEWSYATPPEWQPFLTWSRRLRRFLEGCLPGTA